MDSPSPPGVPDPAPAPVSDLQPAPPVQRRVGMRPAGYAAAFVLAVLLGTVLFVGGYLAGSGGGSSCAAPSEAFAAFCEAYDKLHAEYVDELDDEKLVEGALEGLFQYGVGDPYSSYMTAEEYQSSLGDLSGTFSGIGAELAVENVSDPGNLADCPVLSDNCVLVVVAPIEGSPAEAAGIRSGDVIQAVDGVSVVGTTIQDQIGKVRGPEGTEVTLTVERGDEVFEVTITRAEIVLREVDSELLDGHVGYIALHGFSGNSTSQFRDALGDLLDSGADQIVFDLRDNPGGYITSAQEIASEFVGEGLLFSQESAGDQVQEWEATEGGQATDPSLPVVLMVNSGSASASEIVAAALAETERATLIGEPTFGKNTVQIWDELVNGGGVRITISRWFTPNHHSVAPDGVQPDIVVTVPDGTPADEDPVLDRALEYLASLPGTEEEAPAAVIGWQRLIGLEVVGWWPARLHRPMA